MAEYGATTRPRRRWGRRLLITFIVLLIIVAALLAVADRVSVHYAERIISDKAAEQVAAQKATSEKPEVTIEGIPFLTQVAAGKYHEVKINMRNFSAPTATGTVKMTALDATAEDVRAPIDAIRSGGSIVATTVTGQGTITYSDLAALIGQPGLKISEKDGKLTGSMPVSLLGQTFTVAGTAKLSIAGDGVKIDLSDVKADGAQDATLIKGLVSAYVQNLGVTFKLPALPLRLKVTALQPQSDGLHFTAEAHEVSFTSNGL